MLDRLSLKVLKVLNKYSEIGEYKVANKQEIIKEVKKNMTLVTFDSIIDFLKKSEYINVKFSDNEELCFSTLPKSRAYIETDKEKKTISRERILTIILSCIFSGMFAFFGAFLAIIILK